MTYIPLKPIPLKDRTSLIFLKYGQIDVKDGTFVLIDKNGIQTHIPVGSVACIMLEPGTRVSHMAVRLAAVKLEPYWSGWERPVSGSMHRGSLVEHVLTGYSIWLNWHWMMNSA